MNAKSENAGSFFDTIKLVLALVFLVGGIVGFYYVEGQYPTWLRIIGVLVSVALALLVGYATERGREIWSFLRDANIERQKVVWPTRQETVRTTLVVIVVVTLVGIMLWLIDMAFGAAVSGLVG